MSYLFVLLIEYLMFFEFLSKRFQKVVKIIINGLNNYKIHIFFPKRILRGSAKKFFLQRAPHTQKGWEPLV